MSNVITYEEAMATLRDMFPEKSDTQLTAALRATGGSMDITVSQLLADTTQHASIPEDMTHTQHDSPLRQIEHEPDRMSTSGMFTSTITGRTVPALPQTFLAAPGMIFEEHGADSEGDDHAILDASQRDDPLGDLIEDDAFFAAAVQADPELAAYIEQEQAYLRALREHRVHEGDSTPARTRASQQRPQTPADVTPGAFTSMRNKLASFAAKFKRSSGAGAQGSAGYAAIPAEEDAAGNMSLDLRTAAATEMSEITPIQSGAQPSAQQTPSRAQRAAGMLHGDDGDDLEAIDLIDHARTPDTTPLVSPGPTQHAGAPAPAPQFAIGTA